MTIHVTLTFDRDKVAVVFVRPDNIEALRPTVSAACLFCLLVERTRQRRAVTGTGMATTWKPSQSHCV